MSVKEVELTGGSPWGFRMHGGVDQNQPLRISRRFSDTLERSFDVNPGRKASISGIREGDVISSINGRTTKGMTNAEAHTMLKSAGPVLKLGLNEDKEMSPRRRSVGKGSELKRPSQIMAEVQKATPQAPVYATIRPAQFPHSRPTSSLMRSSLNSLPTALNSSPLIKSITTTEETVRFHPTNPFYTTLPSNYSSASKLPVPNGRAPFSSVDRNKLNDTTPLNDYNSELKSPSYFTKLHDSGPSSLPYFHNSENVNGCVNSTSQNTGTSTSTNAKKDHSSFGKHSFDDNQSLPKENNSKNPFEQKRNSDPFEKYLKVENMFNKKGDSKLMTNSQSESCFRKKEEVIHSTVTEHKFSEVEEVKTIKKFIVNGNGEQEIKKTSPITQNIGTNDDFDSYCNKTNDHLLGSFRKEHFIPIITENTGDYFSSSKYGHSSSQRHASIKTNEKKIENDNITSRINSNETNDSDFSKLEKSQQYKSPVGNNTYSQYKSEEDYWRFENTGDYKEIKNRDGLSSAEASPREVVVSKPPLKSPPAPAQTTSPCKPVWRPGAPTPPPAPNVPPVSLGSGATPPPPPPLPVWTPHSAGPSPQPARKTFCPVHFEETPPARRKFGSSEQNGCTSGSESESRLRTSHSAPASGLNSLGTFNSRLPKVQNPTVTLLQKTREGQIPRGSNYLQQEKDVARLPRDRPSPPKGDPLHALRKEYASEGEADRSEYERGSLRKMADTHKKLEGIGPITKDGMPVTLRSEVKDPSKWYKKMYDTIHKNKYDDDYVTIRYKSQRGQPLQRVTNKSQYAYFDPRSGYLSEPEGGSRLSSRAWSDAYDSDATTGPRRRTASVQGDRRFEESPYLPSNNKYSTLGSARASQEVYKNQPGRIENYVPGKSSVVDKEAKQWWDEVMDIFDGHNLSSSTSVPQASNPQRKDLTSTILSKSNMARALKESGYESDSTLIFKRREETEGPLSPAERRAAYKDLQAGGEPPLRGFRSPAPPRQDESEIEYIPITSTLTKIRVHKKTPKYDEYICYPATEIETDRQKKFKKQIPSFISVNIENPPAPPRRISSRSSKTLRLVTSTRPASYSPKRTVITKSKVDFLKDRISHKLTRQNTHIISKRSSTSENKKTGDTKIKPTKSRIVSTSAPPAVNRKTMTSFKSSIQSKTKTQGTSSFGSPRKTMLPTDYSNSTHSRYSESPGSVTMEEGAGRRTPISNILDKMTSLDKLWSSEKRNERIDIAKTKSKSLAITAKVPSNTKIVSHRSRDMIRMAEKVHKLKVSNVKLQPTTSNKNDSKLAKQSYLKTSHKLSKLTSNIIPPTKHPNNIKVATITNLKKKKSVENNPIRPRSIPCHEVCSKRNEDLTASYNNPFKTKTIKKKTTKSCNESESGSQYLEHSNEISYLGSHENILNRNISTKDIERTRKAVVSDSFFQHLFLGNAKIPSKSYQMQEPKSTVLQKAKIFQSYPPEHISTNSINSYLVHRKPVSLSRFKLWDRYSSPSQTFSPRSISWPGRIYKEIRRFDSLAISEEFGSTSSIATVRSKSEPPTKMYFSQTSRPKSPTVIFNRKLQKTQIEKEHSPSRIIFSQTSRPVSPKIIYKNIKQTHIDRRSKSQSPNRIILTETVRPISPLVVKSSLDLTGIKFEEDIKVPTTIFFSQTSRPVSPRVIKSSEKTTNTSTISASQISIKSPSYRRIHSARLTSDRNIRNTISKGVLRSRSADDTIKEEHKLKFKTKSEVNLCKDDPDYSEYVSDMNNATARSERFRELNRYYSYLERVGELEKATSNCDLRHRRKDEEIIDFDRWKKIRAIERAEEELNNLYDKLKIAQTENDVLFYPRDVKDFRWNYDNDRSLKIKEKSVEDLKDHFQQITTYDSIDGDNIFPRDTYKPLWRATSVAETAFNLNKNNDKRSSPSRPVIIINENAPLTELRKKLGFGNRLWSSLSMEQVNTLKNQLNAIYSKELESKASKDQSDMYTVNVPEDKNVQKPTLQVRCHSLISPLISPLVEKEISKSESIAAITYPTTSVKELKNNVNKIQMSLSENEKRKISQTLSKEVLEKINKLDNYNSLSMKKATENNELQSSKQESSNKIAASKCKESNQNDKSINTNYTMEHSDAHHQSSASETETASSDVSNKTVIYKGSPPKEVQKKVEYFESVNSSTIQTKTIYHARESSDEKETQQHKKNKDISNNILEPMSKNDEPQKLVQSQSCVNFKELFGETEKNKFISLPSKPELYSRSPSPFSEVNVSDRRTPDTLRYSSDETVWRSRSPSPEPERYWRAYIKLARAGEVRRLARRFDSPTAVAAVLRRHRSDPEIARNTYNSNTSYDDIFLSRRNKIKSMLPVARVPLRPTNRFMPHIDIISKLARLRRRTTPRSRSAEEPSECRSGEVDRMRRRFETMSILGQIYASAPDVRELQDIAPHLGGTWIAHRFPKRSDNNRSIQDPSSLVQGKIEPIKREVNRTARISSDPNDPVKLSSILKTDIFAKQGFDPSLHKPASRYEPPRAPPRPPPASWSYRLAPFVTPSRHTVTFQESDKAPEPPRRTLGGSYSDTESPRRYVESDVNIHFRCPVRHDPLPIVPERELARQQAEHMKKLYREQRRNKYLQELQDMQNRRHQDNFTPSQKNILPLNRYDEVEKIVARALYAFNGQTAKELSFRKGDMIHIRRQIDANWYEGELHGRVGLFPYNYVEIIKGDESQSPRKPNVIEGRARAKFDFIAQTNLELPLKKGELVVLSRRIDHNWWEGRNGNKTGIFPDSYVTILQEPSQIKPDIQHTEKPVASPAAHGLLNGSAKRSMGSHSYTPQPNSPALSNAPQPTQPLPGYVAKPVQATLTPSERGYGPPTTPGIDLNNTEPLYVDTNAEAIPFRAMYKYRPQNPDELDLNEGDTVYVLEQCDDGWYVGSSQRTGRFGTFPGNYVERI